MIFFRKKFNKIAFFIFVLTVWPVFSSTAEKAETMFVADFDGLQTVPPNNSTARGFGVVVLNDAETEIRLIRFPFERR